MITIMFGIQVKGSLADIVKSVLLCIVLDCCYILPMIVG